MSAGGAAADILEATLRDIDTDKGEVSPASWGSLLAVLGILRGDHDLPICPDCGYACREHSSTAERP